MTFRQWTDNQKNLNWKDQLRIEIKHELSEECVIMVLVINLIIIMLIGGF